MWGSENPHIVTEHERLNAKMNVLCAAARDRAGGHFFLREDLLPQHIGPVRSFVN